MHALHGDQAGVTMALTSTFHFVMVTELKYHQAS